ncbi:ATP-binding cassette domain-containing protein [Actinocorallia sp. API 0066]|uniref:ABC transporter ATP-binding protein n=1 Tax=Actinocorallia sp. API 0066 TaxID=2896846 RepID=UPI001E2E5EFB|nr:ATP-binding cassette domain-containing protein [Actinocorallia sp. API 0066]MCD0449841.1 ATP-binding cassette domain-containing protein [Actinocorallia sp. API 0066]
MPLEVADLRVTFGTLRAVRGVSFTLDPGECLAIVGPSASGKTALLRALAGRHTPDARVSARLLHADTTPLPLAVAYLPPPSARRTSPDGALAPEVSARVLNADGTFAREGEVAEAPGGFGLRRRAALREVLGSGARVIVVDEPTAGLDGRDRAAVVRALAERKAAGAVVVLASHDLAAVAELADRVVVLHEGEPIEQGPAAGVLAAPLHPRTRRLLAGPVTRQVPARAPETGRVVLEARELGKGFDGTPAVRDVSFQVRAGEALGVLGGSGAGKTTLARLLAGTLMPDGGAVLVAGRPWPLLSRAERRRVRRELRVVPQDPAGLLAAHGRRATVGTVLDAALRVGGVPSAGRTDRVAALLRRVGLRTALLHREVAGLSGGELRLVAVAEALATAPRVLLWDEPLTGLDGPARTRVLDLVAALRAEDDVAHVVLSHDPGLVREAASRVVPLDSGSHPRGAEPVAVRPETVSV